MATARIKRLEKTGEIMYKIPQCIIDTLNEIPPHVIERLKAEDAYEIFGCVEGIQSQIDSTIDLYPNFLVYYAKYLPGVPVLPSEWCMQKYAMSRDQLTD